MGAVPARRAARRLLGIAVERVRSALERGLRTLRGRRVGKAAFEAEVVERPLEWSEAAQATLELADGRRLCVDVVPDRSTRAGRIEVGRSLRVTLALPGDLGAEVAAVEVGDLRIEL